MAAPDRTFTPYPMGTPYVPPTGEYVKDVVGSLPESELGKKPAAVATIPSVPEETVNVVAPETDERGIHPTYSLPKSSLAEAMIRGYKPESPEHEALRHYAEENSGWSGSAKNLARKFGGISLLGVPDVIERTTGEDILGQPFVPRIVSDPDRMKSVLGNEDIGDKDPYGYAKHQWLGKKHVVAGMAGDALGLLATVGLGEVTGAFKAAGSFGRWAAGTDAVTARVTPAAAEILAAATPEATEAAIAKAAPALARRIAESAVAMGWESTALTAPAAITEAALGDPKAAGEMMAYGFGIGAVFGALGPIGRSIFGGKKMPTVPGSGETPESYRAVTGEPVEAMPGAAAKGKRSITGSKIMDKILEDQVNDAAVSSVNTTTKFAKPLTKSPEATTRTVVEYDLAPRLYNKKTGVWFETTEDVYARTKAVRESLGSTYDTILPKDETISYDTIRKVLTDPLEELRVGLESAGAERIVTKLESEVDELLLSKLKTPDAKIIDPETGAVRRATHADILEGVETGAIPKPQFSMFDAHKIASRMGKEINWRMIGTGARSPDETDTIRMMLKKADMRSGLNDLLMSEGEKINPDFRATWQKLNEEYSIVSAVEDAYKYNMGRFGANRRWSLTDHFASVVGTKIGAMIGAIGGPIGAAVGSTVGAMTGAVANRVGRTYGPGLVLDAAARAGVTPQAQSTLLAERSLGIGGRMLDAIPKMLDAMGRQYTRQAPRWSMWAAEKLADHFDEDHKPDPSTREILLSWLPGETAGSKMEAYEKLREKVSDLVANPAHVDAIVESMKRKIAGAPMVSAAMEAAYRTALTYIASTMPKPSNPGPFGGKPKPPPGTAIDDWAAVIQVANNPGAIIPLIANGKLKKAHVEAAKVMWPEFDRAMRKRFSAYASIPGAPTIPTAARHPIMTYLGSTPGADPLLYQSSYAPQGAGGGGPKRSGGGGSPRGMADRFTTSFQKASTK